MLLGYLDYSLENGIVSHEALCCLVTCITYVIKIKTNTRASFLERPCARDLLVKSTMP